MRCPGTCWWLAALALLAVGVGLAALPTSAGNPPNEGPGPARAKAVRVDGHGDPLPPGAVARLGTLRWRTTNYAYPLTFSPDGKRLLSADRDCLRLWDVASGNELGSAAIGYVERIAFSHDGQRILCASGQTLSLLDGHNGKGLGSYENLGGDATAVLPHPTRNTVAVLTRQGGVHVARSDQVVRASLQRVTQLPERYLTCGAWSADGKTLAVADSGGKLWLLGASMPGRPPVSFDLQGKTVRVLAFAPDGKALLVMAGGATLWVDVTTGKTVRSFTQYRGGPAWWLSPDGRRLALGNNGSERVVQVWDTQTGELLQAHRHRLVTPGRGVGMAFSPDGTVGANVDGHLLCLWDVQTGKPLSVAVGHSTPVTELSFLRDGRHVVTSAADGRAAVWDAASGKLVRAFQHDDCAGHRITNCFAVGGSVLVTRVKGGLSFWDTATGKAERRDFATENGEALREVAPSGQTVVLGTTGGALLWDVKAGKVRHRIEVFNPVGHLRSEERRVGKEWRSRWGRERWR